MDVDECQFFDSCSETQECHNLDGSYICCEKKLQYFENEKCIDHECNCGDFQFCEEGQCICENNYLPEPVDGVCQDFDECEDVENNRCTYVDENSVCRNLVGSFACDCKDGYSRIDENDFCEKIEVVVPEEDDSESSTPFIPETDLITDSITEKPIITTELPKTSKSSLITPNSPIIPETLQCSTGFEITDFYGTMMCTDIDECQTNNGDCYGMCMNYYGTKVCYEYFDFETRFCHHYHVKDTKNGNNYLGYKCRCFDNYHVCADTFSCFPNKGYREFDAYGRFKYDKEVFVELSHLECPDGSIQFRDKCYFKVEKRMNYGEASDFCSYEYGAELASISDKKTWWVQ